MWGNARFEVQKVFLAAIGIIAFFLDSYGPICIRIPLFKKQNIFLLVCLNISLTANGRLRPACDVRLPVPLFAPRAVDILRQEGVPALCRFFPAGGAGKSIKHSFTNLFCINKKCI